MPRSCTHHTAGPWSRRWDAWLVAAVAGFVALESAALAAEGSPATLSAYLRRLAGVDPRCQHCFIGRAVIVLGAAWVVAHLGWGRFGWDGRR